MELSSTCNHDDANFSSAGHCGFDGCRPWFLEHVPSYYVVVYKVSDGCVIETFRSTQDLAQMSSIQCPLNFKMEFTLSR